MSTKAKKPSGYEPFLITLFKDRFEKIKKGLGTDAIEKLSKKQIKDSKSQLLDRTTKLTDLINQVVSMGYEIYKRTIEKDTSNAGYNKFKKEWDLQANKVARMNVYNQIQTILDENPSYRKNADGTYVDPNLEKSKKNPEKTLMGDIYMKLQKFYEKYDTFYKNSDGEYLPNGLTYDDADSSPRGMGPLTGRQYVRGDWSTGERVDTIV